MGISGCMIKLIRCRNQRAVTGIVTGVVVTISDSVPHIIYGVLRERGDGDLAPQIIIETGRVILVAGTRPENICDVRETIVIVVKVSSSRIPAGVIRIAVRVIAMTRVVRPALSAAGGHAMTADLIEMASVVAKCFVAVIGIIDPGHAVIPVPGERVGMITFILDSVKIIAVGVGVVDSWPLVLTGRVALGEWKLDLSDVARHRIAGVMVRLPLRLRHSRRI